MRDIFVDFEMNSINTKFCAAKKRCWGEIIEIGAVMLDENLEEIDSFKCYVKPEYNEEIFEKYRVLTGISTNMVAGADTFETAYKSFMQWCGKDYELYAWSDNDKGQIRKEMELKYFVYEEVEFMFGRCKTCWKRLICMLAGGNLCHRKY